MRSELQIEASRRNSQKSTGPRTAAGKAVSSQNATQSGVYAEAEIIRHEDAVALDALLAAYTNRFTPDTPEELFLVDVLVRCDWLSRRFARSEAELWEKNIVASESATRENLHDLGRALDWDNGKIFNRLQLRINYAQRNYLIALKRLQQLQADRPARPLPAKIEPAVATQATSVPLGFVSSPPKPPPADPSLPPAAAQNRPAAPLVRTVSIMEACPCDPFHAS